VHWYRKRSERDWGYDARLRYHLERHNKGSTFIDFASTVYSIAANGYKAKSDKRESHGAISLRVLSCERVGDQWRVSGDIADRFTRVAARGVNGEEVNSFALSEPRANLRAEWSFQVSIEVSRIRIVGQQVWDSGAVSDRVEIDFFLH
jgi:hypothetical protein